MNSKIFLVVALSSLTVGSAWAEGYVNSLPLKIESAEQVYSYSESGSGKFSVSSTNNLVFNKPSVSASAGTSQAIIKFEGIPGFLDLNLNAKLPTTAVSGTNSLTVSESADGSNWTELTTYNLTTKSQTSGEQVVSLQKTTRYIKFDYTCTKWNGWGYNPATISLPKSLDAAQTAVSFSGKEGEVLKDTIAVSYSNPTGNLAYEVSDAKFTLRKLTDDAEAAKAGTAQYEVSYSSDAAGEASATLKIYDSGYTASAETIQLSATVTKVAAPSAPAEAPTVDQNSISYTGVTLTWPAVEGAARYQVTLRPVAQTRAAAEEIVFYTDTPSINLTDLAYATTYEAEVRAVGESGKLSAPTEVITFSTKSVNAPAGLSVQSTLTSLTATWTAAEGVTGYVVSLLANDETVATETLGADVLTYTFEGLTKGTAYTVSVVALDGEYQSAALANATATNADFGPQLGNSGFENWETAPKGQEPTNWNSFGNVGGSTFLVAAAKAEQVKPSDNVRPNSNGTKSAVLYSRSVAGVVANGNLTTGKINAGSMTAASYSNYNAIVTTDANYYQLIGQTPDSVTVWAKNVPASGSGEARLSFILHGDGVVKDPAESVSDLTVATAQYNFDACGWTRLSVPFELVHSDVTPKYMLATFTTNKTPGTGSAGDSLYVDDLVLVYNPTLKVETLAKTAFNEGDSFTLAYSLSGTMSVSNLDAPANTVYAELSDSDGSFDNATVVSAVVTTDESGELAVTLPTELVTSENYRIRVVTTNYPMSAVAEEALAIEGTKGGTSLGSVVASAQCRLYPNPAKEVIRLTNAEGAAVTVRNLAGATVKAVAAYTTAGIDVADLAQGVYFVDIRKEGAAQTLKFVKE